MVFDNLKFMSNLIAWRLASPFCHPQSCLNKTTMAAEIAPESTLPYPPIHTDKKFVVLSDWLVCILRRSFILVVRDELSIFCFNATGMALSPHMIPMIVRHRILRAEVPLNYSDFC
jgi:hypothetical protein